VPAFRSTPFLAPFAAGSENGPMTIHSTAPDGRRFSPRVALETLCNEIRGGKERPALVWDVSVAGLRLARPFFGGSTPREIQLEFELPGVDAILWARGETCFDEVRQVRGELWRSTGIRLAAAAAHDLRVLREFVHDTWRPPETLEDRLCFATAYACG
jgi:hypothetical protein